MCRHIVSTHAGTRDHAAATSFAGILPEETETEVRDAAKISMGTEISEEDILNIQDLCTQVLDIYEYRTQLHDYLKNRMQAIAPNLSVMVGELVGARLIAHAGSLINLAKYPASTVQILGAEKALFRALKTKHETPKYGLIYHASLVGQAAPKDKGKVRLCAPPPNEQILFFFMVQRTLTVLMAYPPIQISRLVASRSALAIRVDALGENATREIGEEGYQKVEQRLRLLEGGRAHASASKGRTQHVPAYDHTKSAKSPAAPRSTSTYNEAADNTMKTETTTSTTPKKEKKDKKKSKKDSDEMEVVEKSKKDKKKEKKEKKKGSKIEDGKKKRKRDDDEDTKSEKEKTPKKDKKKKKKKTE